VEANGAIGLIAGNGSFPILFAQEAKRRGTRVIAVALKEEADPLLKDYVDAMTWLSLGQLGKTIEYLKEHGVQKAVMAGQVKHTQLFRDIVPDFRAVKLLSRVANKKAESLLGAVTQEFESEGIQFLSSATYLEHWLAGEGLLTRRKPSKQEEEDIRFGFELARQIAGHDIGQTVVIKEKSVVAVEAMEGTDACIRRAGEIAGPGCVVVKAARPKQDLRFDIPVVGERTLESLKQARATTLAVEAAKTLLLNKEELLKLADAAELSITGVRS
jgi:UDP-2,3-diacylglucosamine hydrolase